MEPDAPIFIRLYLDEDVHKRVASALRLRGFDVVSVHELGRWGMSDEDQLVHATGDGRTLFTYNTPDYLRLHGEWMKRGQDHGGIIVSDQLPVGETVHRLLKLLNRITADEMHNRVRWLQAFR